MHLQVSVGDERYAMAVDAILEVARTGALTAVPGAPEAVLGVRSLRGRVLPVARLASLVGVDGSDDPGWVVVSQDGERVAGLAVDAVLEVSSLSPPLRPTESPLMEGSVLAGECLVGVLSVGATLDRIAGAHPR